MDQGYQNGAVGGFCVKVMTDEQIEVLRRQISVYAALCQQLVEMHRAYTAQQGVVGLCDPLVASGVHMMPSRQRWTPTPSQLHILENMFYQGNGTPSKQRIKDITNDLSHHGPISETNVYNWFQNRRARSKRKHPSSLDPTTSDEAVIDMEGTLL